MHGGARQGAYNSVDLVLPDDFEQKKREQKCGGRRTSRRARLPGPDERGRRPSKEEEEEGGGKRKVGSTTRVCPRCVSSSELPSASGFLRMEKTGRRGKGEGEKVQPRNGRREGEA